MGRPVGLNLLSVPVILTLALEEWVSLPRFERRGTYNCLSPMGVAVFWSSSPQGAEESVGLYSASPSRGSS